MQKLPSSKIFKSLLDYNDLCLWENTFGNEECREVWWAPPPISDLGICVCAAPARPVSLSPPPLPHPRSVWCHTPHRAHWLEWQEKTILRWTSEIVWVWKCKKKKINDIPEFNNSLTTHWSLIISTSGTSWRVSGVSCVSWLCHPMSRHSVRRSVSVTMKTSRLLASKHN